jgi:hypothetical protein
VVPFFAVGRLEDWAERLAKAGGEARGVRDMGDHRRVLTGRDPAGNVLLERQRPSG